MLLFGISTAYMFAVMQGYWPILMPLRRWCHAHAGSRKLPLREGYICRNRNDGGILDMVRFSFRLAERVAGETRQASRQTLYRLANKSQHYASSLDDASYRTSII